MKKLPLHNTSYAYLENAYREWLHVLGFSERSVYAMPSYIREFLHYLDSNGLKQINQLRHHHIKTYYSYLSSRSNQTLGGGLSNHSLNNHIHALGKFLEFLVHKGAKDVPPLGLRTEKIHRDQITIITPDEIQALYQATRTDIANARQQAMQARNRALLTIYYGCGLRRNEGVHLDIADINLDTRVLHVRKGKGNKERFVPFNKRSANYLQEYIYDHRPILLKDKREGRLFISMTGRPMSGGSLYHRLKLLQLSVDDPDLRQKHLTLHNLRHSIATHLLDAGMEIEKIQRFLGHTSLESTQIYVHLSGVK